MKSLFRLTVFLLTIMLSISIASTGQAQQKEQIEYD